MAAERRLKSRDSEVGNRIKAPENAKPSPNQLKPKFSLEHLQKSHCLSRCTKDEKAALADRLHEMSQLPWQQIQQSGRHGQGHEIIARTAIKGSIPSVITEDASILAFRFCGKAPMVGFRKEDVFFVVWLDRAFDLYPH